MATMAQAIKAFVESTSTPITAEQIKQYITTEYSGKWKNATIKAHLYACVVNNPKAYLHHPSTER